MNKKILIVEDELVIAFHISEVLTNEGYECIMDIASVDEAIKNIAKHNPALVLIDINLNREKDGIELAKYLLKQDQIPFIFVTSHSDKTTLDRVLETRPYGYVLKPFNPFELIATVKIVLKNYQHRHIDVARAAEPASDDVPFILKKVIAYIDENIDGKIVIEDLTKLTRWQTQHFQKMFTSHIGVPPHKYIVSKKIERAKVLLLESSIPIIQLSFELGFKSHSNFCSSFKTLVGTTPEQYRKTQMAKTHL